jgi:hypothetical protein
MEATQMNVQLDQRPIAPAIWIVVDEEDWSGVNDCGAIHIPVHNLAEGFMSIDNSQVQPFDRLRAGSSQGDWPIESCS